MVFIVTQIYANSLFFNELIKKSCTFGETPKT